MGPLSVNATISDLPLISTSMADLEATSKLREAGDLLNVPILDHIILGNGTEDFTSIAESFNL